VPERSRIEHLGPWLDSHNRITGIIRVLFLDPTVVVEPLEPPHLQVSLLPLDKPVDDLIAVALTNRPELASQQALVQVSLRLLQQEKARPLIPYQGIFLVFTDLLGIL
jgi:hypothetical protein